MPDVMRTFNNVIDESIGKVGERLNDLVQLETLGLKVQVTNFPIAGTFNADDLTENAFACIRVLSQVQDLVTDKSWFDPVVSTTVAKTLPKNTGVIDKNNISIKDLTTNNSSYDHCLLLLKGKQELLDRFKQQFTPFKDGSIKELGERFLQIQDLNSELVSHFANPKP